MKESKLNFIDHSLQSSPLLFELDNDDDDDDDSCFATFVARQDGVTNIKALL